MTGFEEGMSQEVLRRGKLIAKKEVQHTSPNTTISGGSALD